MNPAPARLEVALAAKAGVALAEGRLQLRSSSGRPPIELAVAGPAAAASVPAGSSWELTAAIPAAWVAPQSVIAGAGGSVTALTVPVWPLAWLEGALRLPAGEKTYPREVLASIEPAPFAGARAIRRGSSPCPVDEEGRFRCPLPAGAPVDLALRAEGYVPHYRWDLALEPAERRTLGTLPLVRGASVSGWLRAGEGELRPGQAKVRLLPLQAPQGDGVVMQRIAASAPEARAREDGFFQLEALRPGKYVLEAEHPGYAPARVSPLEVYPERESALREPMILNRPLTLEISLEPAVDWLGKPWQVEVWRGADLSGARETKPAFAGPAPESGVLRVPGQAPGRFTITVFDAVGNPLFSDWDLQVTDGTSARIPVRLEALWAEGTLRLGGEPLAGEVIFGGRHGDVHASLKTDAEGHFEGVLPKAGPWMVEVETLHPEIHARTKTEVRSGEPVEIDLPDTRLEGVVIDGEDKPVAAALVDIVGQAWAYVTRQTGLDGKFEARALPEGAVTLVARHGTAEGRLASDRETVELTEGATAGPVRLRLLARKPCAGRVVSAYGPVPGARVSLVGDLANPIGDRTTTDLEGKFKVDLHARASGGTLVVEAAGYALEIFEVTCGPQPFDLAVAEDGGVLELQLADQAAEDTDASRVLLFQDGKGLPFPAAVGWTYGHGWPLSESGIDGLRIPSLAPGEYRLCLGPVAPLHVMSPRQWSETVAKCAVGYLVSGGTLTLSLGESKAEKVAK